MLFLDQVYLYVSICEKKTTQTQIADAASLIIQSIDQITFLVRPIANIMPSMHSYKVKCNIVLLSTKAGHVFIPKVR